MRSRIESGGVVDSKSAPVPLRWQNENADSLGNTSLPSDPVPFVYCEFLTDRPFLAGYGGGQGQNLYRNPARLDAYVFVPNGNGLDEAEAIAEQIAALFRSYRSAGISCFEASVYPGGDGANLKPPGLSSVVGSYFYAVAEVSLHFDQIG
jgi:hypothetical protein